MTEENLFGEGDPRDLTDEEFEAEMRRLDQVDRQVNLRVDEMVGWARTNYIRVNPRRAITGLTHDLQINGGLLPEVAAAIIAALLVRVGTLGRFRTELRTFVGNLGDKQPWEIRDMLERVVAAMDATVGKGSG